MGDAGDLTRDDDPQQNTPDTPVPAPEDGAARPAPRIDVGRLAFIDVMRTVAVGRVVINHALPWPWLKWFQALPVMFFASGLLVGRSLEHRPWRAVVVGRFRRLAMPTGLYVAFAVSMAYFDVLPGTMTHLWYVWTFLLFTVLSGVLRRLIRWSRFTTVAMISVLVVVLTLSDINSAAQSGAYLLAWVAGMIWADTGCVAPSRKSLVLIVVVGVVVAVVSVATLLQIDALTAPSELGISMAALGASWLALGLLARNQLEALMHVRGLGRFIRYLNKRLLTIYLWHVPPTVLGRRWSVDLGLTPVWSALFVLGVTFALTGLATVAFGGLEDRASASSKKVKARAVAEAQLPPEDPTLDLR